MKYITAMVICILIGGCVTSPQLQSKRIEVILASEEMQEILNSKDGIHIKEKWCALDPVVRLLTRTTIESTGFKLPLTCSEVAL